MKNSVHQFKVKDTKGKKVSLEKYKGKVLMIINTASQCGLKPQLEGMTELYEEFKDQGFEILAFPSNDFGDQEPLGGEAAEEFCVINYEAAYPIFEKVHVKGSKAIDLYKFLSDKKQNGKVSGSPKWNFHKYLIDKEGRVADYFLSLTSPTASRVKRKIKNLLRQ